MRPAAFLLPPILWLMAALVLIEFEGNVAVLRPWQRWAYGLAVFVLSIWAATALR